MASANQPGDSPRNRGDNSLNRGDNTTNWANPHYDRLIAQAAQTADAAARFELFQQAEALLLEEAPIVPIDHLVFVRLVHAAVKGWEPSLTGHHRFNAVWLEK